MVGKLAPSNKQITLLPAAVTKPHPISPHTLVKYVSVVVGVLVLAIFLPFCEIVVNSYCN